MAEGKEKAIWGDARPEDFTPSATLIYFDSPVPLLRGPFPAGASDDPSIGPFVLAFRDAVSWRKAYRETESKIHAQCMAGARIGCSISASKKCSLPWWKNLFGQVTVDFAERERCEELETEACLVAAKELCTKFAREKCLVPFRDARIALLDDLSRIPNSSDTPSPDFNNSCMSQRNLQVTNYRGSALLKNKPLATQK